MGERNPFVYADPLKPGDLIDRDSEADRLLTLAEGGHNSRLVAPRRYGKTSLLLKVMEDAREHGLTTVYVDFYRALTVSQISGRIEEAYLDALAGPLRRTINNLLKSWRGSLKAAPGGVGGELQYVGDADHERHLSTLLDLPKRVFEKTGTRTLVVFDEFQDFLRAEGSIDGLIRSKIQFHTDEASYIFSGSEPGMLAELFGRRDRPLFDQARPLFLGPLADEDVAAYIEERFAQSGRDVGEALEPLLDLVRGHPQRAMLMAHHVFEQTPRSATADTDTFAAALEAVDRETREHFEATWQALARAPNQRRVLVALARGTKLYSRETMSALGLKRGAVADAVAALTGAGELQEANGDPVIVDPLFERWLRK